jgi:hypothetical protein
MCDVHDELQTRRKQMKNLMRHVRFGLSALAVLAAQAQADVIDNHVVVTSPYYGSAIERPAGFDASYALQLGTGSWPFPYVDVHVDKAEGQASYARLTATPSYLTYIHNVELFQVKPGAEISSKTLADGSFTPFFKVTDWNLGATQDIVSPDGKTPDIYLGFSIDAAKNSTDKPNFGWVHLQYTNQSGLSMVSSAMTTSDAGIFALSRETIPAVDDVGTSVMALLGMMGLVAARRRHPG